MGGGAVGGDTESDERIATAHLIALLIWVRLVLGRGEAGLRPGSPQLRVGDHKNRPYTGRVYLQTVNEFRQTSSVILWFVLAVPSPTGRGTG
jgi:hypothetical protein